MLLKSTGNCDIQFKNIYYEYIFVIEGNYINTSLRILLWKLSFWSSNGLVMAGPKPLIAWTYLTKMQGPILVTWINLTPAWISNYIFYKV